ncbi:GNAT family N-acetyltransferase [Novosphingobium sp. FKTRR1]|uniref:GNAT family N-acetyltransferase n=1 Tax=Novosphingobium sp. FKTRR1 TaxID=2879118 RepID=UPI001CEFCCAF|nr:GNAT family N-acetyltransferase [Novosphingobium sp. FKTRR1]
MDRNIVTLGPDQRKAAIATLALAFQDDPAMSWMIPDPVVRTRRLPRLMAWSVDDHLANGLVLGTPGAEAVTLWRPPGTVHRHAPLTPLAIVGFVRMFGLRVLHAERLDRTIFRHLPAGEAQFYLRMAGVRPDKQGQGLGGLAIRAGLVRAAELNVPAVLETATESNVGLYRSLGFAVISEWQVSGGGPRFWTMKRE